jgi:hypothetical protein
MMERFALMLRSVAAGARRRVSKHEGARGRSGPTSSFATRARKSVRLLRMRSESRPRRPSLTR